MTTRNKMVNGKLVPLSAAELAVVADPVKVEAARQRRELRETQAQAQTEQAALEKQAVQYFIRGEVFPAELKDYHAALSEVLTAPVGEVVALPAQPAILSAPRVR